MKKVKLVPKEKVRLVGFSKAKTKVVQPEIPYILFLIERMEGRTIMWPEVIRPMTKEEFSIGRQTIDNGHPRGAGHGQYNSHTYEVAVNKNMDPFDIAANIFHENLHHARPDLPEEVVRDTTGDAMLYLYGEYNLGKPYAEGRLKANPKRRRNSASINMSSYEVLSMHPPHGVTDKNKLHRIYKSMFKGWKGRPLISLGNQLLTGAHRYAALKQLDDDGIEFDVPVIDIEPYLTATEIEGILEAIDQDDVSIILHNSRIPRSIIAIYVQDLDQRRNPKKTSLEEFVRTLKKNYPALEDISIYVRPYEAWHPIKSLYLSNIRISPPYRGKGIGSKVLTEIINFATSTNLPITLIPLPEDEDNVEKLRSWYRDHGFEDWYRTGVYGEEDEQRENTKYMIKKNPRQRNPKKTRDSKGRLIPQKYLSGYKGAKLKARIKEIEQRRDEYKAALQKYGDEDLFPRSLKKKLYRPFKTDKGIKGRSSSYTVEAKKRGFKGDVEEKAKAATKYYGSKIPSWILDTVMDRGMAAWAAGGHRPGQTPQSWGYARVNSFLVGGKTFWTADSDLARKLPKKAYREIADQSVYSPTLSVF